MTRARVGSDDGVERVRSASDIVEVVGQYVGLKKAGRSWKGLCPFHQEKTPSFTVSPERQTFHCFGCGAGGDVFGFVEEAEKLSFAEALRFLADRAGIPLPQRRPSGERGDVLTEACREAAEFYRRSLLDPTTGRAARAFLAARSIQEDVQARFGMGYAGAGWDGLSSRLLGRFGETTLVRAGLVLPRDGGRGVYDRFRDRVVVPLRERGGRVVGFGGRALGDEEPKYLNSPESPVYRKGSFLFGLGEAREALKASDEAVLVEGYFDVLALHQAGVTDVVAAAGTAVTSEQAALLRRYVGRVCLALDGDRAGEAAARRALGPLLNAGLEVRVLLMPAGEDPDSFVRREGGSGFSTLRGEARTAVDFLCSEAGTGGEARGRALAAVTELAAGLDDPARREGLLVDADRKLGVGLDSLRRAAERRSMRRPSVGTPAPATTTRVEAKPIPPVETSLLALLLSVPDLAPRAAARVPPERLRHPVARAAWTVITAHPEGPPARWIEKADGETRALLSALAAAGETAAPPEVERALDDHVWKLESEAWKKEREELRWRLAGLEPGSGEARALLKRIDELSARLATRSGEPAREAAAWKGELE